jgi:hypothetical protein
MKQLALIILLALGLNSYGQSSGAADTTKMQVNYYWPGNKEAGRYAWRLLAPPQDTVFTKWGIAQKGSTLYVGNGTYWTAAGGSSYTAGYGLSLSSNVFSADTSVLLYKDTTLYQNRGFWLGSRSVVRIGEGSNKISIVNPVHGDVIASLFVSDSLTNVRRSVMAGISANPQWSFTDGDYNGNAIAGRFISMIAGTNTGNWTGSVQHSNLAGVLGCAVVKQGSTGNVSSINAIYATLYNLSTDTVENAFFYKHEAGGNLGTILRAASYTTDNLHKAQNYVHFFVNGRGSWNIPNGYWSLYNDAADSVKMYMGVGTAFVGDTVDRGDAIFQVSGKVSSTDKYSYSTNINGSLSGNDLMTINYFDSLAVKLTSTQTISGVKTFSSAPVFSTMTQGSLFFAGSGGALTQDNTNLFWDDTNNRLGIGTTSPSQPLDILGTLNPMIRVQTTGVTTGSSAQIRLQTDGGLNGQFASTTSGASNAGLTNIPNATFLNGNLAGGLVLGAANASGIIYFATGGTSFSNERMRIRANGIINISTASSPTYADNAAALAGGLVAGDVYKTATGTLMIVY